MLTRNYNFILLILYFLSGLVSIAFEILWSRYFSLQFGASIFGVIVTVSAFMAGLGAGSLLAVRFADRLRRPLRVFFTMELFVALFALAMPLVFRTTGGAMEQLAEQLQGNAWFAIQGIVTLLILFLPACAMGFGFPFVLKAVQKEAPIIGKLYGFNALGGVIGSLLPLWLLPTLGWVASNRFIALVGIAVALTALLLGRYSRPEDEQLHWRQQENKPLPAADLLLYALIGAAALILEISWARLYGMVMLRTEYVLAIILAAYLSGIGLGSLIAARLRSERWFTILPLVAGVFAAASLWFYAPFSAWVERTPFSSLAGALLLQGALLWLMVLPVTLVLGAWLPLLTRLLGHNKRGGAILYGVNSLGAAVGVIVTGLVLIPALGSSGSVVAGLFLLSCTGLYWAATTAARRLRLMPLGLVPLLLAWPVSQMPPAAKLLPIALAATDDLYVHEDALAITHVVAQDDGQRLLLADLQRMDASSDPEAVVLQRNQARPGLLLRPDAKRILFLGMGTGITASMAALLPEAEATAVELSTGAIRAAREQFAAVNGDRLQRLAVVRDDVRHFLMAETGHYDLVIGDLFHPDLVGRGALLSVQHFARVRRRLGERGLYVQWLSLNQFDLPSLQAVVAGFARVYPQNQLFLDGFRLALVGSRGKSVNIADSVAAFAALDESRQRELSGGEGFWTWAGRCLGPIPDLQVPVQDEWAPVIEYSLPRARFSGGLNLVDLSGWLLARARDPQRLAVELQVPAEHRQAFAVAARATRTAHQGWINILKNHRHLGLPLLRQAWQANPADRWIAAALADGLWDQYQTLRAQNRDIKQSLGRSEEQLLEAVQQLLPDHPGALQRRWELARARGDSAAAARWRQRFEAVSPLSRALGTDNITH